ncbi:MAG: NUDIX hydrolase [Bacteroidota bacterium]|jgi:8-oxo-dGTP pyrophosphatase MutT (NUDIX family)|nr:NUDIX hydrolase [Sphingobacteriales bacterium]
MYKIFINEKPFIITEKDSDDILYAKCRRVTYAPEKVLEFIKDTEGMSSKGMLLLTDDSNFAFNDFYTHFVAIEASGGVVFNDKNELLLIKRMGKWDLPKGKIDAGETLEEAALREVEEECGIGSLTLGKKLPPTYHTYKMHNHRFLKITRWFEMRTAWDKELIPQTEEQITEAAWFAMKKKDLKELDTYTSISDLLAGVLN